MSELESERDVEGGRIPVDIFEPREVARPVVCLPEIPVVLDIQLQESYVEAESRPEAVVEHPEVFQECIERTGACGALFIYVADRIADEGGDENIGLGYQEVYPPLDIEGDLYLAPLQEGGAVDRYPFGLVEDFGLEAESVVAYTLVPYSGVP